MRTLEDIEKDLATEEGQGGLTRLSPIGRLVADVPALLAEVERLDRANAKLALDFAAVSVERDSLQTAVQDVTALCNAADQAGNRIIQIDYEPIKVPWTRAVRVALAAAAVAAPRVAPGCACGRTDEHGPHE